jgi:hypothetical protein
MTATTRPARHCLHEILPSRITTKVVGAVTISGDWRNTHIALYAPFPERAGGSDKQENTNTAGNFSTYTVTEVYLSVHSGPCGYGKNSRETGLNVMHLKPHQAGIVLLQGIRCSSGTVAGRSFGSPNQWGNLEDSSQIPLSPITACSIHSLG